MTTEASIGHGSLFERSSNGLSTGVFSTVGEVLNISPPSMTRDVVDATHMQSPQRWREYIAGLKDGGEMSIETNHVPGSAATTAALADINSDTPGYYKITFPDETEWGFAAFMTGIEISDPLDDKMTATYTFQLTGKPAFVA